MPTLDHPTSGIPGNSQAVFDMANTKEQEDQFAANWDPNGTQASDPPPPPGTSTPEVVPKTQDTTPNPIPTAEPENNTVMFEAEPSSDTFTPLTTSTNPGHTSSGDIIAPSTEDYVTKMISIAMAPLITRIQELEIEVKPLKSIDHHAPQNNKQPKPAPPAPASTTEKRQKGKMTYADTAGPSNEQKEVTFTKVTHKISPPAHLL